ncbi:AAA family ATPase [Aminipila butyrica]|uniref:AAA family ATPase n=1 Tax=Aminipila butyrica TaxID=433296 RepID=A0A858BVK1_9FIRM|nr:AAA family ATPase [Aminipila butyrica]QIB69209.1 AAA family ATPase [Aminipila butyrica]
MVYINGFQISTHKIERTNAYPYNVFEHKDWGYLPLGPITVLYGNNASGKSTLLNIMANKFQIKGAETIRGDFQYFQQFIGECSFTFNEDDQGRSFQTLSPHSRYIKSEDILYEVKKIQQDSLLVESHLYQQFLAGVSLGKLAEYEHSWACKNRLDEIRFALEKYSNGETSLQIFEDSIYADSLYILDEPEMSLSPQNQVLLAKKINEWARFLSCQFIIATHSPFFLGTLDASIYNLDTADLRSCHWSQLENVRFYHQFFKEHEEEFC